MNGNPSFEAIKSFLVENRDLLKESFGVKKAGISGSFVKGEQKNSSDIDVLIEFEESKETFNNYMNLKFYLEDTFGRKVDLVVTDTIKPLIKEDILREAVYV
jgi:hypothetical protein